MTGTEPTNDQRPAVDEHEDDGDRVHVSPIPEGYTRYAGLGIQFALTILVLGALGYWGDHSFGTTPWLMIAGILLGSVGGFVSLLHQVPASRKRSTRSDRSPIRSERPPPR